MRSWIHGWSRVPCEHWLSRGYTCFNISVEFVEVKCALHSENTEFEKNDVYVYKKNRYEYLFSPRIQYKQKQNQVDTVSRVLCKQRLSTWTYARIENNQTMVIAAAVAPRCTAGLG